MNNPRIIYTPRPDATPEGELNALAAVYRIILDRCKENAAGVTSTNGDDAMKGSNNDRAYPDCTASQRPA